MTLVPFLLALAQLEPAPDVLLKRASEKILDNVARMPRYACTQTTEREMRRPVETRWRGATCKEIEEARERGHGPEQKLYSKDRVRLDLIYVDMEERHQWTGGGEVSPEDVTLLYSGGILAKGDFSGFTASIFGEKVSRIEFAGTISTGGRRLYEYRYDVELSRSTYFTSAKGAAAAIPYSGTFRIDAETAALVQLIVRAERLPEAAAMCSSSTTVDFASVSIRGNDTLLPAMTRVVTQSGSAHESVNLTRYDACREFTASSVIRFESTDPAVGPPSQSWVDLAALSRIRLRLETTVDSRTASAGDEVRATPAGGGPLVFHGRILRMVQTFQPKRGFWVALDFNEVRNGEQKRPIKMRMANGRDDTPAGAWFWLPGRDHAELKRGWESVWEIEQ